MASYFEQSLPLCYTLSAVGGMLEVGSVAVLAVPEARRKEGIELPRWLTTATLAANVAMQLLGSLSSNLFACWFGPVSVVCPLYFSATLVTNMLVFGALLGLENFSRQMRIGTYVIFVATILLTVVGPGIQDDQDIGELLRQPVASVWFSLLLLGMIVSTALMVSKTFEERKQIAVLLVARSTSYTLNLTVSRAFLLNPTMFVLVVFIVIKLVSGSIYTYAIVVQSTTVTQSKIVPLNATTVMLVNAITGILIWQDWRVIDSWTGYICVFLLLVLGCDLLLSSALLMTNDNPVFGATRRASEIIESTPMKRLFPLERSGGTRHLYVDIPDIDNYERKEPSVNRREAWKKILSLRPDDRATNPMHSSFIF